MKLSFVVPCYNEADNVKPFIQSVYENFPITEEYEVVFVNDGSADSTMTNLREIKKTSPCNIKIVDFSRNFGKESAMYAGLQNACGELVSIIDADLQQDPAIVKKMVEMLDSNPEIDCVCACQEDRHEGKFTTACKNAFYKFADRFTEISFQSGASDFRTFRKNVRDALLSMGEFHRFSKGLFSWVGFNTVYIPYTAKERQAGKSSFNFIKLLKYAFEGIIAFSTAPLKFASVLGSFATLFGIIYAIITLIRKFASNINVDGFTQLVILISFIGGIQLFTIGIIGEYLARNYIQTKNRPIYIAKEVITYENNNQE
ncbi:MAG: glycosyltransferase family 2 protein [Eubacterium sp.]|nr:glycosyltransferase family 2 protein [Eubacterium sp.]